MSKWDLLLEVELKKQTIDLHQFVMRCCYGIAATPEQVIDNLLSFEDEIDVKNGNITTSELRLHIELWLANGMPPHSHKLG